MRPTRDRAAVHCWSAPPSVMANPPTNARQRRMRLMATAFLIVLVAALAPQLVQAAGCERPPTSVQLVSPSRLTLNFNREWRFMRGEHPGAEKSNYDDRLWSAIHLPHSFSIPYFAGGNEFYVGAGWYRKQLEVPRAWRAKRVFLEFEAAFQVAEVFVNGVRIGEHRGGYTGFSFDVTAALKPGKNLIAARVDNRWNAQLAPRAGEHVFSGGIYRDVRLVVKDPLHVAWYGTFVTTPQVSNERAVVNVKTEIVNDAKVVKSATVRTSVIDAEGRVVTVMESTQAAPPGQTTVFDQTSDAISRPRLWSPAHPNLYRVQTTVFDCGKVVDEDTSPLGFRWFEFTADRGFFLNGEHYYFKGANVHQDHAGWGDAVTNAGFARDVALVKEAGFDFIRGSHYPHDPAFADACDRLGVLLWSENAFWGTAGPKVDGYWTASAYPPNPQDQPGFEASVQQQLREMIRIHRNHPAIIVWSMGNETFFTDRPLLGKLRGFLGRLVALSHELDATRPAAIGGAQRPLDENRIDTLGDVAGYNGDGAVIPMFQSSGVPSVVSEYGSTSADRPGDYDPGWGDLAQDDGEARKAWRSGQALWCAFDHGSIFGKFGAMGMIDYFRLPKRQWYWYRSKYRGIPAPAWPVIGQPAKLKLTADKTTLESVDGTDDAHVVVTITDAGGNALSNTASVTLAIESGPGEFPTGSSITFEPASDIAIRDGQAAIEFRSYYAGETVIRASSPGLQSDTLKIVSRGTPAYVAGRTPAVKARPYARFQGAHGATSISAEATFGVGNPTGADSAAADHASGLANDGDTATFWQAAPGESNAWWRVDLERNVAIARTELTLPREANYRYRIDVSDDGRTWKLAVDQTRTLSTMQMRSDRTLPGTKGRFLRVTFVGGPDAEVAALAEMVAYGVLLSE
jgi:beta-galactosidase